MEVRKIRQDEMVRVVLLQNIVFLAGADADYKARLAEPLAHSGGWERAWGVFDEGGRLVSSLEVHDYALRFDGNETVVGGIAGVGTLPENRNAGCVRMLFEAVFRKMRERGAAYSLLYPFSFNFYRKFGYELCYSANMINFSIDQMERVSFPDGIEAYEPGADLAPYKSVYEAFAKGKNLSVARDGQNWDKLINHDPYLTRRCAYLHRKKCGSPDAYVVYHPERAGSDFLLRVLELAYLDQEGLHAMIGFMRGQGAKFSRAEFEAPSFFDPCVFFPESRKIVREFRSVGMLRIIEPVAALSLLRAPEGEGSVKIRVRDAFCPENTGTYKVEWEGGRLAARRQTKGADISLDIETLAQLTSGYLSAAQASLKKGVLIEGNAGAIERLFPQKETYLQERF
ncbi:MAG: GNAT family N-acetyltransferase [Defluviitaleaceae bacterium]|nr:GNAT family N-acetyltransferase [Defluviitaleaceae bacterium]